MYTKVNTFSTQAKAVNLEQIDRLLANWRRKVDLIGQNLVDLHGLPTYQRLAGSPGFAKAQLTGITQAQVTPALDVMSELFQYFDLLVNTIDKATELRKQVSWFLGSELKVQEIEQLLNGPSIQLATVQTPLAHRGLLTAAETTNAIAPDELLAAMTDAFQVARDAVLVVDEAWLRLEPALARAEVEIVSLQKLADSLGQGSLSELVVAQNSIATLRSRIDSDPLGVSADFHREIQPLLTRVKINLDRLVQQQTQIRENLERGHQLLKQLVQLHRQAEAAFTESQEKVLDHSTLQPPLAQSQLDALRQWLTRLEAKFAEGLLHPVTIGLHNWTTKAKEYIALEENAWRANKIPLETRQELRGRLDALQAKALARGLVEEATLSDLAEQAKQLLYTRPTPLDRAAELVGQYEKQLNSQEKFQQKLKENESSNY